MAVLLNEYKRLQYIIDSLVMPFLKSQHPKWRELILTYLKFLDENATFKAKNITDNVNVNDMYTELLDDFLNLYFKDVIDLNKFGLNDDNKRLFIALSKLIGNLKSTKTSFGFFFNSFTDFSIPTDTGDINVNDLVIELEENSDWWLVNNDPTRPFTYVFRINETELTNLKELIKEVHPAGFLQLFLYTVEFFDNMDGTDCLELSINYGALYNGKWKYDAIMEVEGAPAPLLYNGGYTINEFHCNDLPIESNPIIEHVISAPIISGYDQFYELAGSDQWENPTDGDEFFDLDFGPDDRNFSFAPTITHDITSDLNDGAPVRTGTIVYKTTSDQGGNYWGTWGDGTFIYNNIGPDGLRSHTVDGLGNLTYEKSADDGNFYDDGIWGDGNFIYCACGLEGLRSYSVDGLGNMTLVDTDFHGANVYFDVWGDGTFLYVATYEGLKTYSVDGLGNLTYIDTDFQGTEAYRGVWGDGTFIYVACAGEGLRSYSVDGGGNLTYINTHYTGTGTYRSVHGNGTHIFVGAEFEGLKSYSVDGGGILSFIDDDDAGGSYQGLWWDGDFLLIACGTSGIRSYSVDGAGLLTPIDVSDQGSSYVGIWGDGNYVYCGCFSGGLRSYEVI